MADAIVLTMDDLETAVRANAAFEERGDKTFVVSAMDDATAVLQRSDPDVLVLTGSLHERRTREMVAYAREHGISTLGLLEQTEPDPPRVTHQLGLTGWLSKPLGPAQVVSTAQRLAERRRIQRRTGILGESAAIQEVLVRIEQMAPVSSTVLIEGESGTGKELAALALHELSPRRDHPFIAINCSALPETLLESELFGHEKGAFTGASERRVGRFELADRGTLFLDEIGETTAATQVKLLRVLESRTFFRVGGASPINVDVRVVAATNRTLKDAVARGTFRDDLFFRINVLSIYLPPLRERKSDIPLLVRQFVEQFSKEHGKSFRGITPEAMQLVMNAHWPGNVRQLRNLVESMVVLAPGQEIRASDIPNDIRDEGTRLLPVPVAGSGPEAPSKEFEFIFRSLVDLKLQIEDLRRRIDEPVRPRPAEMIEVGAPERIDTIPENMGIDLTDSVRVVEVVQPVLYQPGMSMAEAEKAAILGALTESDGNRRQAAQTLGIGERTLYRKIKEYGLD